MTDTSTRRMEIARARPTQKPKEMKIILPRELCVRLHSRKILSGVSIADTVTAALEVYFAELQRTAGAPLPSLAPLPEESG